MDKPNFFEEGSPYLEHPLLTPERTAREVDFLLAQAGIRPGGRVLDIGCGPGRHSLELARRGCRVLGIDPAEAMVGAAQARAVGVEPPPQFRQSRGEDFRLEASEEPFDTAICLFTTLGQMDERGDNHGLVKRAFAALHPGGIFIVEVPQREPAAANLKATDRFGSGKRYTDVVRRYDPLEQTITEVFTVVSPGGKHIYLLRYRLFDRQELCLLLEGAGFEVLDLFSDYDARSLEPDSPFMITVSRKPTTHF